MPAVNIISTLTGANQFSTSISIVGDMSLTVSGTFTGNVVVQRSFDGLTWHNVETITSATEKVGFEAAGCQYRVGVEAGEPWSGTAVAGIYGYTTWRYK